MNDSDQPEAAPKNLLRLCIGNCWLHVDLSVTVVIDLAHNEAANA